MAEASTPEQSQQVITYEVKSRADVTQQDVNDLGVFVSEEINRAKLDRTEQNLDDAAIHTMAAKALADYMRNEEDMDLIIARDRDGKLIGYRLIGFASVANNKKKVTGTYIGVKPENRRQGIGLNLLSRSIQAILDRGITEYETDVRREVPSLYDRLGITYTTHPLPDPEIRPAGSQRLIVHLK